MKKFNVVAKSVRKIDSLSLATGKPMFVADLKPADSLYVKALWSPHAHARIVSIDVSEAEKMPGVHCILHHGNVPRVVHTTAGQGFPEPSPYDSFLFDNKVRFVGDRVAAVAADTPEQAAAAVKAIKVVYEELPAVFTIDDALKPGAPVIHDEPEAHVPIPVPYEPQRNLAARVAMDVGDVEAELKAADTMLDREFYTDYAHHCPIEPHIVTAHLDVDGRVIVTTSTQVPFHVRRIVAQVLQIPVRRIRVVKPRIGGGFGGKQEVLLEPVVAMFALRTGRAVHWKYTREEEFVSSRTRHPEKMRIRAGVKKDGSISALALDCCTNSGAYGAHALTVVCNSGSKILPLYRSKTIHFVGESAYTNLPVGGAYRGYGATQSTFGIDCMMDELAEMLGMDPLEFRRMNTIRSGETSPVFRALGEGKAGVEQSIGSCEMEKCMKLGAREIGWKKRGRWQDKKGRFRRGIGMASLMQGSSIPEIDMGAATMKMNDDGSFNLLVGATDIGTGSDTILAQIAAETLGCDVDKLIVYSSDTDTTPFDVGAYASSTTYLSGMAVKNVAEKVAKQIAGVGAAMMECKPKEIDLRDNCAFGPDGKSVTFSEIALRSLYGSDQFQIGAISSHITHKSPPPFSAHFCEVEVDTLTGRVRVLRYVAAVDCGTAVNPKLAEGQTEGGVLNGISYALTEQYRFSSRGRMLNPSFAHYKIMSMRDKPALKTILVPSYEKSGPYGAKSVSEICINGPLPCIANAIYNAVGVRMRSSPFMPNAIWKAIQEREGG